ncbi:SAV_915 family protein [Nocardioides pacificus]
MSETSISDGAQAGVGGVPAPPVVYLPVTMDESGEVADFRMIKLADGRVALLGYTALDRFIDCCGDEQPWLLFETRKLGELHAVKPFDVKLLDVPIPEEMRAQMRQAGPVSGGPASGAPGTGAAGGRA